jgi:tetratricopeptide (TPR) repeat protein
MAETPPDRPRTPEQLLTLAQRGGPNAAAAARRAAWLWERSNPDLALSALATALRLDPLDADAQITAARLKAEKGDFYGAKADARTICDTAIDLGARARAAFLLGEIARLENDEASARSWFERAAQIEDKLLAQDRSDPSASRWYARARGRLADLDIAMGERERGRAGAEGALALLRAVAAHVGEPPILAADIADAEARLASIELDDGKPTSARRRLGEAIGRYEALAITEKDEPHWLVMLSDAWALRAEAELKCDGPRSARDAIDKSLHAAIRLARLAPPEEWRVAAAFRVRGAVLAALEDDAAAESFAHARTIVERLAAASANQNARRFLINTLLDQADHALRKGEAAVARDAAQSALGVADQCGDPELAAAAWDRVGEYARLVRAAPKMLEAFARAVAARRQASGRAASAQAGLAAALLKHGDAALAVGEVATAEAAFSDSASIRLQLTEQAGADANDALALAVSLERLGLAAMARGDSDNARAAWEDELLLVDRIFADTESAEATRFRAIVEAHLAGAGGPKADAHRNAALAHFDELARAGILTEREAALRRRLWGA